MARRRYVTHLFSLPFINIEKLYTKISFLLCQGKILTLQKFRLKILNLHWEIGVEHERQRITRDENYQELLFPFSEWLVKKFRKRFGLLTLEENCKFYLVYLPFSNKSENAEIPEFQIYLTWNHYRLLIHISCPKTRNFYEKETSNSGWSPFLLEHFVKCRLFKRLSASINKESMLRFIQQGSFALFAENNNYLDKFIDK